MFQHHPIEASPTAYATPPLHTHQIQCKSVIKHENDKLKGVIAVVELRVHCTEEWFDCMQSSFLLSSLSFIVEFNSNWICNLILHSRRKRWNRIASCRLHSIEIENKQQQQSKSIFSLSSSLSCKESFSCEQQQSHNARHSQNDTDH